MRALVPFIALCLPFGLDWPAPAQQAGHLTIEDLYRLDGPRAAVLSPDGKTAAFIRTWIDAKTRQERHSLWLVEGTRDQARPLEEGQPDARAAVFSPDGKWIAFLSTRSRPPGGRQVAPVPLQSDAATDIWLVPAKGGTALPLAGPVRPYGRVFNDGFYGRFAFSPDGKHLVFVADDGKDPRTPAEIANDVRVVRADQGEGYTGYGPAQVWVASFHDFLQAPEKLKGVEVRPIPARHIERLTQDDVWYGDPQWSPDGKTIAVHANKTDDRESVRFSINKNFDIWAIDVASKQQRQLTKGPGPEVAPRFSPDGKKIACLSVPRQGSHRDVFNMLVLNVQGGESETEPLFNHHGPGADRPPHAPPAFPLPEDCWEGDGFLIYNTEAGVHTRLAQVDVKSGKGIFLDQPAVNDKQPLDIKTVVQRDMRRRQLLPEGNAFLRQRVLAQSKVLTWKSDDLTIEGILTVPPPQVAQAPYAVVVHPHGGPHSRSALGFDFTVQVLAAQGYAVFQPNFRGSSGYGQKFSDADRNDLGGGDMRDILAGIDHLIQEKLADPERLFVYGTSYGGYMTCWLVGQTNRFRAAVAQNAVTDLNMMWALSDLQSWTQWEFGGLPWEVPAKMRQRSPLTHVAKVQTPTLILHAEGDRRCPLPMGLAYHRALKARGVPTHMVIYPDEGHGIRQPRHREDVLRRVLDWFALHGKK